jgi:hypothetical protein
MAVFMVVAYSYLLGACRVIGFRRVSYLEWLVVQVVDVVTVRWPGVARRQVAFFCFAKRKQPKKRRPCHPSNSRSLNLPGGAETRLALLITKESEPQTSTPLIRPADSDFGGAGRGQSQNQNYNLNDLRWMS